MLVIKLAHPNFEHWQPLGPWEIVEIWEFPKK